MPDISLSSKKVSKKPKRIQDRNWPGDVYPFTVLLFIQQSWTWNMNEHGMSPMFVSFHLEWFSASMIMGERVCTVKLMTSFGVFVVFFFCRSWTEGYVGNGMLGMLRRKGCGRCEVEMRMIFSGIFNKYLFALLLPNIYLRIPRILTSQSTFCFFFTLCFSTSIFQSDLQTPRLDVDAAVEQALSGVNFVQLETPPEI